MMLLYCSYILVVDSGATAFSDHLLQRSCQILGTPDFIDQPKPFTSFNPRFQGCQHAFGPGFQKIRRTLTMLPWFNFFLPTALIAAPIKDCRRDRLLLD
jgi:hypothetical protein